MYQAKRWHDDPRFFAPMVTIVGGTQVFAGDIIHIQDQEYGECYAKVMKFMKVNTMFLILSACNFIVLLQNPTGQISAITKRIISLNTYHEAHAFLPDDHYVVSVIEIISLAPRLNRDHLKVMRMPNRILEELTQEVRIKL